MLLECSAEMLSILVFCCFFFVLLCFFFFKQKTAYEIYQCDWSSDVCSSDLVEAGDVGRGNAGHNTYFPAGHSSQPKYTRYGNKYCVPCISRFPLFNRHALTEIDISRGFLPRNSRLWPSAVCGGTAAPTHLRLRPPPTCACGPHPPAPAARMDEQTQVRSQYTVRAWSLRSPRRVCVKLPARYRSPTRHSRMGHPV